MVNKKTPAEASPAPATGEGPGFEEALERLETIVEELEGGSLTLEQSIARYEEGVKLSRRLTQTLDQAEKKIERLMEAGGESGGPTTAPMELESRGPDAGGEAELPF
jgi:exodeoxyribonuclease VII small subunit